MTVVIVGAGAAGLAVANELLDAGVTDFVILDQARDTDCAGPLAERLRPGHEVVGSVFDDDTDTWTLRTGTDETFQARAVVATHRPPFTPWIPELQGRNDFRGLSFHAAQCPADFDPTGKRIAVVGTDATAGHHLERLRQSAAAVLVIAHAPRWIVTHMSPWIPVRTVPALRWLRRHARPARGWSVVESTIEAVTPAGIRTGDGVEHRVDAIIYGTGFHIPDRVPDEALVGACGLTIRRAWYDGMEPYLGIAVHGFPNYFFLTGPDTGAQARYIAECVGLLHGDRTRIEVLRSSQQVFNDRAHLQPAQVRRAARAFDVSSGAPDEEIYDGTATLTIGGAPHPVRVRLRGHLDPIDGRYHWQGTVLDVLPDDALERTRAATLTVGEHSAPTRIVEQTPWGTHSIAGIGAPPYHLSRT